MKDSTDKGYSLYDLSTQSGIVRKKNINDDNSNRTISFYDASVNSNRRNDGNEKNKDKK